MLPEEDPRFRHLEKKIGVFIALALAGVVAAIMLFGVQKNLFVQKYELRFTADRGTGFTKGMPVKLSGFRIGRVTSMALNDQAMVDIVIEIDSKYRSWIRTDSMVKLVKEGLVGDHIIDLSAGSPEKPELKPNDPILYVKTKGLDEMADEIADKVKPVLSEIRDIIAYINDPEGDLKASIRNLEQLTRNLEETRRHADNLLVSTGAQMERVAGRATITLDTANRKIEAIDVKPTIERVNTALDRIDATLPGMLDKTGATLENFARISEDFRSVSEKAFPKIPALMSQAEDVLFSSDRLIRSIQNSWLFRDSEPPGNGGFIRGDSYE